MKEKLNLLTRELDFDLRKIQLSNIIVFLAIVVPPPPPHHFENCIYVKMLFPLYSLLSAKDI